MVALEYTRIDRELVIAHKVKLEACWSRVEPAIGAVVASRRTRLCHEAMVGRALPACRPLAALRVAIAAAEWRASLACGSSEQECRDDDDCCAHEGAGQWELREIRYQQPEVV